MREHQQQQQSGIHTHTHPHTLIHRDAYLLIFRANYHRLTIFISLFCILKTHAAHAHTAMLLCIKIIITKTSHVYIYIYMLWVTTGVRITKQQKMDGHQALYSLLLLLSLLLLPTYEKKTTYILLCTYTI